MMSAARLPYSYASRSSEISCATSRGSISRRRRHTRSANSRWWPGPQPRRRQPDSITRKRRVMQARSPRDYLVRAFVAFNHSFERMLFDDHPSSTIEDRFEGARGHPQDPRHPRRQGDGVVPFDEKARRAVLDDVRDAADPRREDRDPQRHRLEDRLRDALARPRSEHEEVEGAEDALDVVPETEEEH